MLAGVTKPWTVLLLMALIAVVAAKPPKKGEKPPKKGDNHDHDNHDHDNHDHDNHDHDNHDHDKDSDKHEGHCGDNELGVCKKEKCSGSYINWHRGRNKCPSGESCCRRTTSYGCSTEKGHTCQFPFLYNREWHDDCTTVHSDHGKAWCSYDRDDYGKHIKGKWGVCNSNCTGADTRCITCDNNSKQYYMHPSDCTKFLQCSQGVTPIEKSCPPGTHWDQSLLTCNHKTNTPCVTAQYINSDGSCKTEGTDTRCITCDSSKSKQYYMHPSDCTKFLQCSQGVPIEKSCPLGTHWDQSLLTCNHKSESPCVTAQYINSDGSCKTDEDWCHSDPGCREKYTTCRKLMCKTLPSNYKRHMKECALEMKIVLPEREPHPGHDHDEHPHPIIECGRPFRPLHPPQDGIMQLLDPSVATKLRKCILIKSRVITSWDGLVNRGVMLDKLYTPFLSYSELVGPIKEAIETTCEEPVDYEIHDFYRCVHKTCIDNIVL